MQNSPAQQTVGPVLPFCYTFEASRRVSCTQRRPVSLPPEIADLRKGDADRHDRLASLDNPRYWHSYFDAVFNGVWVFAIKIRDHAMAEKGHNLSSCNCHVMYAICVCDDISRLRERTPDRRWRISVRDFTDGSSI
jgi:hypothetical protein